MPLNNVFGDVASDTIIENNAKPTIYSLSVQIFEQFFAFTKNHNEWQKRETKSHGLVHIRIFFAHFI